MMNTMLFVSSRGGRKNGTKRLTEIERMLRYVTLRYVTLRTLLKGVIIP